jgi:hypothetical protein
LITPGIFLMNRSTSTLGSPFHRLNNGSKVKPHFLQNITEVVMYE